MAIQVFPTPPFPEAMAMEIPFAEGSSLTAFFMDAGFGDAGLGDVFWGRGSCLRVWEVFIS